VARVGGVDTPNQKRVVVLLTCVCCIDLCTAACVWVSFFSVFGFVFCE
jgi:ribosomal protein S13